MNLEESNLNSKVLPSNPSVPGNVTLDQTATFWISQNTEVIFKEGSPTAGSLKDMRTPLTGESFCPPASVKEKAHKDTPIQILCPILNWVVF